MNLQTLKYRAVLFASTAPGPGGCRIPKVDEVLIDGRTTKVFELGFFVSDGDWAADPEELRYNCSTPGCVMHLAMEGEAMAHHVVAKSIAPGHRDLRALFRYGVSRGWFRTGGYRE